MTPQVQTTTKTTPRARQKTAAEVKSDKPPKDIRRITADLMDQIEETWFQLSVNLSAIYHGELWKDWKGSSGKPYRDFEEYTTAELNVQYRIAMWRVKMGDAIRTLGITPAQVKGMGWTKFKELTGMLKEGMTKKQVNDVLAKAKDMTFADIKNWVKKVRTKTETVHAYTTMSFRFIDEQADVVEEALKIAMRAGEFENDRCAAMEYMAMSFQLDHNPEYHDKIMKKVHTRSPEPRAPRSTSAPKRGKAKKKTAAKKKTTTRSTAKKKAGTRTKRSTRTKTNQRSN